MAHLRIGEILVRQKLVKHEQIQEAIAMQKKEGGRIGEILVRLGVLSEEDIVSALSTQLQIPYATTENQLLHPDLSQGLDKLISLDFAKKNLILPIKRDENELTCAIYDPLDLILVDNLKVMTGCDIKLIIATKHDLTAAIDKFYSEIKTRLVRQTDFSYLDSEDSSQTNLATPTNTPSNSPNVEQLIEKAEEAPVIKLVDLIIRQAIEQRASDIHIEPFKDKINLRYRIDGSLYQIPPPSKTLMLPIVSRLKILAKLDIAEKRLPQDGGFAFKIDERLVDLRISTIPTVWGEKVVMRILDKSAVPLQLGNLGFSEKQLKIVRHSLTRPYGLFFVTGPTGSGKSTTLYAALNETIDPHKNIMTAEDPVEFKLEGINQVGIRSDIGLTFATALRSFLRQDPDVIMVGEVRDLETAQICVRAALTGHFVLSTLHTNDAASAITRLTDIGIEPYLLTPSLCMIVAQRLARRLCPKCKDPVEPTPDLFGGIKFKSDLIYKAVGCPECNHTGYRGRVVITESMLIDDNIRELISRQASYSEINDAARKNGMDNLFEDGIKKVEAGITSFDEILSVTKSS